MARKSPDLNLSNRPVRTRMPGGVGGARSAMIGPYPDCAGDCFGYSIVTLATGSSWPAAGDHDRLLLDAKHEEAVAERPAALEKSDGRLRVEMTH